MSPITPNEIEATIQKTAMDISDLLDNGTDGSGYISHVAVENILRTQLTQLNANRTAEMEGLRREISHLYNYTQHDPTCICYLDETKECDCGLY